MKGNLILRRTVYVELWSFLWVFSKKSVIPFLCWKVRCLRNLTPLFIKIKESRILYTITKKMTTIRYTLYDVKLNFLSFGVLIFKIHEIHQPGNQIWNFQNRKKHIILNFRFFKTIYLKSSFHKLSETHLIFYFCSFSWRVSLF